MTGTALPSNLLDSLTEGCQVIGRDYTYLYLNDAAVRHSRRSREELLGRRMGEVYPDIEKTAVFALLERCMIERAALRMDNEFRYPDGTVRHFELRFEPVPDGVFILSLDVTAQVKREADLRQSQKMETIGRLAGGIAHDFNNLLSVIIAYADVAMGGITECHPLYEDLKHIRQAGDRASSLTKQLLAFSRKQVLQPVVLDLNAIVAGMVPLVQRLIGEQIELETVLASDLGRITGDPAQIEQVVMNLAANARDAMPAGGKLTIGTANAELDETYTSQHVAVKPGSYAMLSVTDTGVGMDEETRNRIFEPFFTTKPAGKGTGLGMATVYGIVTQSGGNIWVYSEPGKGTAFKIYLPREGAPPGLARILADTSGKLGAGETVLLVEDEEPVRRIAERILSGDGYRVLAAQNGEEAMDIANQAQGKIRLLLTDVVMPRISGSELAVKVSERNPGVRVLYMSGYTDDVIVRHGILEPDSQFIGKPFNSAALRRKVREVLDA